MHLAHLLFAFTVLLQPRDVVLVVKLEEKRDEGVLQQFAGLRALLRVFLKTKKGKFVLKS